MWVVFCPAASVLLPTQQIPTGISDKTRGRKLGVLSRRAYLTQHELDETNGLPEQLVSEIVPLRHDVQRFEVWIGIDDWVGKNGAVRFTVGGPSTAAKYDLWTLVARDFPEELPRRQMKWERFDPILEQDWPREDYRELAERYAAACFRVPRLESEARAIAATARSQEDLQAVRGDVPSLAKS